MGLFDDIVNNHNATGLSSASEFSTTTQGNVGTISSKNSCPIPTGFENYNIHGSTHQGLYWAVVACAIATFISSISLILFHLMRYRVPKEQRQIVRLSFTPFIFAIVAFGEISNYQIAAYLDPIGDLYEALGLCALFLLYVQFAAPSGTFGEDMFQAMRNAVENEKPNSKRDWPKISWIAVFQYPLTELLAIIVQEATLATGRFCATSLRPRFGHLWVQIISSLGLAVAVFAILQFYGRVKVLMKARRGMSKLLMFKIIVGLRFIQGWVFSILMNHGVLKTSSSFSYGDLTIGVQNAALLAAEMVLISLGFWYAYTPSEYSRDARPRVEPIGFLRALVDALNPTDIILGISRGIGLVLGRASAGNPSNGSKNYAAGRVPAYGRYGPVAAGPPSHPPAQDVSYDRSGYMGDGAHEAQPLAYSNGR